MADRPRLALLRRDGSWYVDYAETQERARILNLFGTTLVITSYTVRAEAAAVCAAIQKLNPQYNVEVMVDGTTTGICPAGAAGGNGMALPTARTTPPLTTARRTAVWSLRLKPCAGRASVRGTPRARCGDVAAAKIDHSILIARALYARKR